MTTHDFDTLVGRATARLIATQCGYTPASWRQAVQNGYAIAPERLACMTQALRAHRDTITAAIRAAEKDKP